MPLATPTDPYGFFIGLVDGTQARNFLRVHLPKDLPEPEAEKIVEIYQMDEGLNHPGYRVFDTRAIDISHENFELELGVVSVADLDWLDARYKARQQVLISWKEGYRIQALFQSGGFKRMNYPLNMREFGRCKLAFHLVGSVGTTFTLATP